ALDAATVALMLFDAEIQQLIMTASAGRVNESFTHYTHSLAASSFGGLIASRDHATTVLDVETTDLDVTDNLRHSGVHSLLGVRFPLQRQLLGVMYIGVREVRQFSARERRGLEAIAEHLAILIENVRLNDELEK